MICPELNCIFPDAYSTAVLSLSTADRYPSSRSTFPPFDKRLDNWQQSDSELIRSPERRLLNWRATGNRSCCLSDDHHHHPHQPRLLELRLCSPFEYVLQAVLLHQRCISNQGYWKVRLCGTFRSRSLTRWCQYSFRLRSVMRFYLAA